MADIIFGLDIGTTKIGAIVGEVSPDSPAFRAGFKVGDRITSVGGEAVMDAEAELRRILARQ